MSHPRRIAAVLARLAMAAGHRRSLGAKLPQLAIVLAFAASSLWACGPRRIQTPEAPGSDLILLLSDPEGGATGRAIISNTSGTVELQTARAYTRVSATQPPTAVTLMSETEIRRLFGDAVSALPPQAQHFTLNFRFESDELTEESRALVAEILQAVSKRPVPEVAVMGHTDTTGTHARNFELGLKRAQMIRSLLVDAGLNAAFIEVTSHGEGDLRVRTADEVLEPRNRRVEITIR
jgi:outer membrane protein OmpA-like peptidoglycan-associated protein